MSPSDIHFSPPEFDLLGFSALFRSSLLWNKSRGVIGALFFLKYLMQAIFFLLEAVNLLAP